MIPDVSPLTYKLEQALVQVVRAGNQVANYDISNLVVEFNIYESLYTPQITGTLTFVDSAAITSLVSFNGTEKLRLQFRVEEAIVDKEFYIVRANQIKDNESGSSSSAVILDFCDKKSFLSNFRRISHAAGGEISKIIEGIYDSYLNEKFSDIEASVQEVNVIIPYLTPLAASVWLRDRATTEWGEPFFLYATTREGNFFRSLGSLLSEKSPFERKFVFSESSSSTSSTARDERAFNILNLDYEPEKSIIDLARRGALHSTYVNLDPLRKTIDTMTYDASKSFQSKLDAGRLGSNKNMLFDDSFYIDNEERLLDTSSASFLSINPTQTYDKGQSYSSETQPDRHLLKIDRLASLQLLDKQKINIIVPGWEFLRHPDNRTIGKKIEVAIKKDKPVHATKDLDTLLDNKHSGEYLIVEARHKFNMFGNYTVSLTLARTASPDPLTNTEVEPF